jgi:hypothetical protein
MRRPGSTEPDPPGGRAQERLREFLRERDPSAVPPEETQPDETQEEDPGKEKKPVPPEDAGGESPGKEK